MYSADNSNPKDWVKGQEAASGPLAITVEKHKLDFKIQYGIFSDKPSENITRWLEKAEIYQKAHMIPSLEMAAIVIHCLKGEPFIKAQRMLDVPGEDYPNSDHFTEQDLQKPVKYKPYVARVYAQKEIKDSVTGIVTQEEVEEKDAEPTISPVRFQPKVTADQCLKAYLLELYGKKVNLTEADKFLSTFKTQKPRQSCSNYLDEFVINYENYAHMKWTIEQIDGILEVQQVVEDLNADPPQIGVQAVAPVEGNHLLRNAEMIQLATDGLCKEFKIHCDNTAINLNTITFPTLENEVQNWQRNTETGKTFTMACTPANAGKHANVSALEMSDYFTTKMDTMEQAQVSATTMSNRGQRGIRGNRGYGRGGRGFRGRSQEADNLQNLPYNLKTHKMEVSTITDKHRMVQ